MSILLWHGYLLGGTGSNVYTRALAREWSTRRARGRRRLPGARIPSCTTSAARESSVPELPGGLLPVFVLDRYEGLEPRLLQDFTADGARALRRGERGGAARAAAGRPRLRQPRPARRARRRGDRRAVPREGARLGARVLDARQRRARGVGARVARAAPRRCSSARSTSARCSRTSSATSTASSRCRPASTSTSSCRSRATRRSRRCSRRRAATRRTRATRTSGCPTRATPSGSRSSSRATSPTVVYFGKLIDNKGVHLLLEALRRPRRAARRRRLRRLPRRAGGDRRRRATLFTGPLEHRHLAHLLPLADVAVVPSIFPEAFGMVAAEAAAAGVPPLVARHSGLAEVAAGLEDELPGAAPRTSRRSRAATPPTCARKLARAARAARADRDALAPRGAHGGRRALVLGGRGRTPPRACNVSSRAWATSSS